MKVKKIKEGNFITIQWFMVTDLKLKGNELIVYACIYGFSQAENQKFSGSLSYLAEWTNMTKQGVIKCLKSLEEKGLIEKNENFINGVKFCDYSAKKVDSIKQSLTGALNKVDGGIKQSLPNNIENNIIKKVSKKVSGKEDKAGVCVHAKHIQSYDDLLEDFGVYGFYREAIFRWIAHLNMNGVKVINERLKSIIVALDMAYGTDDREKTHEIDEAINRGFLRLPSEE